MLKPSQRYKDSNLEMTESESDDLPPEAPVFTAVVRLHPSKVTIGVTKWFSSLFCCAQGKGDNILGLVLICIPKG